MRNQLIVISGFVVVAIGVVAWSIVGGNRLLGQTPPSDCFHTGAAHRVVVHNNRLQPAETVAKRCDTLTMENQDAIVREIGFGTHAQHLPYDGVAEKVLQPGEHLTVILVQVGSYHFHDHLNPVVTGSFTVN